ncbi:pentatricopeptide repeat-containing protein At2g33760-like [Nymphaea colorata]|nr:pentatricopeptide repeat-containing protein At2g33760-like [Nymphaea colorata]
MDPISRAYSLAHRSLVRAGPHLKHLYQVHAHMVVTGQHRSTTLLTKLLTLSCMAGCTSAYAHQLFVSVPCKDAFLYTTVIRAMAKSNLPEDALHSYSLMLGSGLAPSSFTLTASIKACADLAMLFVGRAVHSHAVTRGFRSDRFVQAALVAMYGKCGDLITARQVFDEMPEKSVIAWNAMIAGYEQNGLAAEAVVIYDNMEQARVEPDPATMVSVLSACSQLGALDLGERLHDLILKKGIAISLTLGTALIDMYARCGRVHKARAVFDKMQQKNVVAWTAMIAGYGMHGFGLEAVQVFSEMRISETRPNDVTFIAVLSACAHAGLVSHGLDAFKCMQKDYYLKPRAEHQVCMVDMLGRAGHLEEAVQFINTDIQGEVPAAVWTAMLGACKMHNKLELGEEVAEHLLQAEPNNSGHYVLLSNLYAAAGRTDKVEIVRSMMKSRGLKKQPGYSLIEIGNQAHLFCMGDRIHPETMEIHAEMEVLMWKLREVGYIPETDSVLHELEEEEREVAVMFHSEKLAVVYGLMKTSHEKPIRILKNLRMCSDCHTAMKFVSVISEREITIRDKHRFHHFKQGLCSCRDYW